MNEYTLNEFLAAAALVIQAVVIFYAIISMNVIPNINKRAWLVFVVIMSVTLARRMFLNLRLAGFDTIMIEYVITVLLSIGWIYYIHERTKKE